jgi:hypothetical protein
VRISSILLLFVAIACGRRAGSGGSQNSTVVAGSYEAAFEISRFHPCGSSETWWVGFDTTTNLDREVFPKLAMLDDKPDSILGHAVTFARFRGETTAVGSYGHLGQYRRAFHVTEVLELRRPGPKDCGVP